MSPLPTVSKKLDIKNSDHNDIEYKCTEIECGEILDMGTETLKRCVLYYSYPSWTQKYGYDGTNAYLRDLGVGGTLVLSTVSCLILLYLADSLGRKTILLVSATLILVGLGFSVTIPNLMTKFFFIGFAAGAEGAFSALFTIMINENTRTQFIFLLLVSTTKVRSMLIAGCFLSYGVGCILINLVTIWIKDSDWLMILAAGMIIITTIPSFFSYWESP